MEMNKIGTKTKILAFGAFLIATLVATVSFGSFAKAQFEDLSMNDVSFREQLLAQTSDKLAGLFFQGASEAQAGSELGIANRPFELVYNFKNGFYTGLIKQKGASSYIVKKVDVQAWPTDTYFLAWQNPYDGQAVLDITTAFDGFVSSTFKYYCGATSTATVAATSAAPPASLIDGFTINTSTAWDIGNSPTSTVSSLDGADNGTLGHARVSVPDNGYGFCMVQAHMVSTCANTGACEQVTSTNRSWSAISYGNWEWKE